MRIKLFDYDYVFDKSKSEPARLDYVFDVFDDLITFEEFDMCEEVMRTIYEEHLDKIEDNLSIFLSFLVMTLPINNPILGDRRCLKEKVKSRQKLAKHMYETLIKSRGEEEAESLMKGLYEKDEDN